MGSRLVQLVLVGVTTALIAACASDDGGGDAEDGTTTVWAGDASADTESTDTESTDTEPAPIETEPIANAEPSVDTEPAPADTERTTRPTTADTTTSAALADEWADVEWVAHRGDPNDPSCQCADGSEHMFHSLDRDPDKVLLYYQGGGACFSPATCDFVDGTYKVTTDEADHPDAGTSGIFDWEHPGNPFADWTVVFVPYCSGDVFLGDNEYEYSPELTVQHRGALHAQKGLDYVVTNYPEASELFVTGSSAGGVPTPRIGGIAADALPETDITVLADASGGYASREGLNAGIGTLWGTMNAMPDWPEVADAQPGSIGIPDLFTLTGQHAPRVELARFDNAHDQVQQSFSGLAGADTTVLDVLDENEQMTEAAGVELDVYVAPGTDHTILLRPELWELEVEGVAFREWLTSLVETGAPGDVRCTDCGRPAG